MPLTVLFVDDDPPVLRALKREFRHDFDVTVAYSAAEAMQLLSGEREFDVVICDVTMPELDGLSFIEAIGPDYRNTHFVILTGNGDPGTYQRARAMERVSEVLSKPASRDEILEAVGKAAAHLV